MTGLSQLANLMRVCDAACDAVAGFVADDALRSALLGVPRERAALGEAVMRLADIAWDRAEEPNWNWFMGLHISSQAPALAAVLLGDVEGEDGAQDGVALSPQAVGALVVGVGVSLARPSSSGSALWCVSRAPGVWRAPALMMAQM